MAGGIPAGGEVGPAEGIHDVEGENVLHPTALSPGQGGSTLPHAQMCVSLLSLLLCIVICRPASACLSLLCTYCHYYVLLL